MNTHASWKNGLFEVPVVDRSRECVGDRPIISANAESYCSNTTWSLGAATALGRYQEVVTIE
jgi:hypothetical protein